MGDSDGLDFGALWGQKFKNLKISQICRLDFLEITFDDE